MNSQAKYTKAEIGNLTFAYITGWFPKGLHVKTKQKLGESLVHYAESEDQIDTFYARNLLKNDTDRSVEFKVISSDLYRSFDAVKDAAKGQGFTVEIKRCGKSIAVEGCKGDLLAHFMISREGEIYATVRVKGSANRFPGVPARGCVKQFIIEGEKFCQENFA